MDDVEWCSSETYCPKGFTCIFIGRPFPMFCALLPLTSTIDCGRGLYAHHGKCETFWDVHHDEFFLLACSLAIAIGLVALAACALVKKVPKEVV